MGCTSPAYTCWLHCTASETVGLTPHISQGNDDEPCAGTSSWWGCRIRASFADFPLGRDPSLGRMLELPHRHLSPTGRTAQWVAPWARCIPLPGGQPCDDCDRALATLSHLGHSRLPAELHLGKRLGGLHSIRAEARAPFRHHVRPHPPHAGGARDRFGLQPGRPGRAVRIRHLCTWGPSPSGSCWKHGATHRWTASVLSVWRRIVSRCPGHCRRRSP